MVAAPIRLAANRSRSGWTAWSLLATMYQLGFVLHPTPGSYSGEPHSHQPGRAGNGDPSCVHVLVFEVGQTAGGEPGQVAPPGGQRGDFAEGSVYRVLFSRGAQRLLSTTSRIPFPRRRGPGWVKLSAAVTLAPW